MTRRRFGAIADGSARTPNAFGWRRLDSPGDQRRLRL